jgi:hypothetical protein
MANQSNLFSGFKIGNLVTNATIASTFTNQPAGRKKSLAPQFVTTFCAKLTTLVKK